MTTLDVGLTAVTARDVMSAPAVTIPPSATLWDAWRLMMASGLRHLVVTEAGRVVGVLDDRAVFAQWPMGPLALRRNRVGDLMARRTRCVFEGTEVRDVAIVMVEDGVDAVPVVGDNGTVLGIVTARDITCETANAGMWRLTV